jgi:HSP20 family protein
MLVRRDNPLHSRNLQHQMSQLFGEGYGSRGREDEAAAAWAPPVDIAETPEALTFTVELPGFKQEDLALRVENGVLTLEGERKFEAETIERNYHRVERAYGKFVRGFTLPSNVDPEKIQANLTDGILQIALPKKDEAKSKMIPISAGGLKPIGAHKAA